MKNNRTLKIGLLVLLTFFIKNGFSQNKQSSNEIATTINLHFEVINRWLQKTNRSFKTYVRYNRSLNDKIKGDLPPIPSYKHQLIKEAKVSVDTRNLLKAIAAAKKAGEQSVLFSESKLPELFSELLTLQEELIVLNKKLILLTKSHLADRSTYESAYYILDSSATSREKYREKAKLFYIESRKFYESHQTKKANNSWMAAGHSMEQAIEDARTILMDAKAYYLKQASKLPDTTKLAGVLKTMQEERQNKLNGIKEFGSYNGHDAPSKYDHVIKELQQMLQKLQPKSIPGRNYASYYFNAPLYHFNRAVYSYNNFAKLSFRDDLQESPAFLLQTHKESDLYYFPREIELQPKKETQNTALGSMDGFAFNHMILLLDVSRSMNHPDRLPLLKEAVKEVASIMRKEDKLTVVIYSDQAKAILNEVSFTDKKAIAKLQQLKSKGKTNAKAGIRLAYKMANKYKVTNGNNRIIMATDGDFYLDKRTYKLVKTNEKEGISLSVFAFGKQSKQFNQLKKIANLGNGNYVHVNAKNSISTLLEELKAVKQTTHE